MKRFNLAVILSILVAIVFMGSANAAPKKKVAAKSKSKMVSATKKKASSRAPSSSKTNKATSGKKKAQAIAKGGASKLKSKSLSKAQPKKQTPSSKQANFDSAPRERIPSGMAGLGLGSSAGSVNSNKAFEIRGQARTLSMMLILRNGKENVNFVKVRQDYATEIAKTEF